MSSDAQKLSYVDRRDGLAKLVVARIHTLFSKVDAGDSASKGQLAALRRAIFSPYASDPQIWDLVHVPDSLMPAFRSDQLAVEERVVHAALGLFARHQQSKSKLMHQKDVSFGTAARQLAFREGGESEGVRRRMNAAATAVSFDEFVRHIAALVSMMRTAEIPFDYYRLLQDLYDYNFSIGRERVRRSWSRDYISSNFENNQSNR
ncbi:MAG: type I-E CRISPR-associated protein Cse2/CasB [Acidobacteriota bacterium]|jgi:CRISPR system Cascade subunit CasB|nr:type I-E CRISPR-associated protein Cse2/CasB [Acidobacteriota bacterium]